MKYDFDRIIDRRGTGSCKWRSAGPGHDYAAADIAGYTGPRHHFRLAFGFSRSSSNRRWSGCGRSF